MKTSILVGILLFTQYLIAAASPEEIKRLAENVNWEIRFYEIKLNSIQDLTKFNSNNPDELVERDLVLCEWIGESTKNASNLHSSLSALIFGVNGTEDTKILDSKAHDLIIKNVVLRGFCSRSFKGDYRSIPYLKTSVNSLFSGLEDLRSFLTKY